jgi:hypothetical protein
MFGPIVKFLEDAAKLWAFRDQFVGLSRDSPVMAGLLIFIALVVVSYLLITNFIELVLKTHGWIRSTRGLVGVVLGVLILGSFSAGTVLSLRKASAPLPVLIPDHTTFTGEPILLKWRYDPPAEFGQRTILYEIQSASDNLFHVDPRSERDYVDANFKNIVANATRYWRVRAVDGQTDQPLSDWSRATQLTQYDSVYRRIETTNKIVFYVSSSENQDVFKWLDTKFRGFDIKLAETVSAELAIRMGKILRRSSFLWLGKSCWIL